MPFARRPKRRVVSRSFRIPPEVDRALDAEARKQRRSKSWLITDILTGWFTYRKAKSVHEELAKALRINDEQKRAINSAAQGKPDA